jgi:hypothetical protein
LIPIEPLRQNPMRLDCRSGPDLKGWNVGVRRLEQMLLRLLAVAVLVPLVAACSSDISSIKILPKPGTFDSLTLGSGVQTVELRPVTAEDLVGPQGQCAGVGQDSGVTQGGIALQMTECEVVKRAGPPENVELGTTDRGERAATLTYISGPRPGIYRFAGGRLYAIERGQEPQPEPPKAKKPPAKKPKSA